MNDLSEKLVLAVLLIATIVAFGLAASEDYNQTVIESMPGEAYIEVVKALGAGCSNKAIVAEYEAKKEYYNLAQGYE